MIFLQIWFYITPALYSHEKRYIIPLFLTSFVLFILGVVFAYYLILPMMFSLFMQWLPKNVAIMADINSYLDFIFNMFLIFGLVFEIPLVIIILVKFNFISAEQLSKQRSYFILIAFTISMLLTPPDVLSMTLLAVPICLLYEIGILIALIHGRRLAKHSASGE
jgi:sec-independent protein translocase protein TatC